jgi:aldehyde dehydrogenase (NAD+)
VLDIVGGLLGGVKDGDPLDPATQVGPMTSARRRERVEGFIQQGRSDGGRVVVGGGRPENPERGFYVESTVFADVEAGHTIARDEIFGPVLAVIPHDDDDHAVRLANDSEYGLGGSVWTRDAERGEAIARRVETGSIGINAYANDPTAPFGGIKSSGLGREMGPEGMDAYLWVKSVYLDPPPQTPAAG